jgi:DNA-binding CsgD family transcriptional regulator
MIAAEVKKLLVEGISATETARRLGIGRRSVYRILENDRSPINRLA